MIETGITLSHGVGYANPNLISDIVFVRRNTDGTEALSFSLGDVAKDATIEFKEIVLPGTTGNVGQGIYKITGEIPLFVNDSATLNQYQWLVGQLFEIHVFYTTGEYRASEFVSAGRVVSGIQNSAAYNRFNNVTAYRSEFGVYLSLTDSAANYGTITLTVDGATALKVNRTLTYTQFYALFKKLNQTTSLPAVPGFSGS